MRAHGGAHVFFTVASSGGIYAEIVGAYGLDVGAVALGHRPSVQCPILIRTPHFCSLLLPAPVNPTQAIANLNPLNLAPNPPLLLL